MNIKEVLKPGSRRWKEFATVLGMVIEGRGCDNDKGLNPGAPELVRSGARAIMEIMGGVEVDATLKYFDEQGGFCDCEIRYNVDQGPGSTEDDDGSRELTPDERRWFHAAEEAVKQFEPIRAKRDSQRRIRDAHNALLGLLREGLQRDEFETALELAAKERCEELDKAAQPGPFLPRRLPMH
jgi:hypothetical protein